MSIFVKMFNGHTLCLNSDVSSENGVLKRKICELEGIPATFLSLYHDGRKVDSSDAVVPGSCYQALLSLEGGKGGFGSMLRMLGAQIDKTTNHDACRDLSGRRMRDVNNEKKLSEWSSKKADMERERLEKRQEKLERLKHEPKHYFVDPSYDKQKQEVSENLDDAITQGIQAAATVNSASSSGLLTTKRKAEHNNKTRQKRSKTLWMGVEEDSDSDGSEGDEKDQPCEPSSASSDSTPSSPDGASTSDHSPSQPQAEPQDEPLPSHPAPGDPGPSDQGPSDPGPSEPSIDTETSEPMEAHASDKHQLLGTLPEPVNGASGSNDDGNKAKEKPLDLDSVSSIAELEPYGLDALKSSLMALGMKCGGTLQQRAERLFSVKGLSADQISPSLLAKPSKGKPAPKK